MTAVAATERGRGRPRQFDEGAVLDAVTELFWEQGFETASLHDIVDAAGLNKSSLYNAFGSKEELFRRALERYILARQQMLDQATSGDAGVDDLLQLVAVARADTLSEHGRRGCLAINSSAELGFDSPEMVAVAQGFRDHMRTAIRRPLERATNADEIDASMVDVYVDTAMSYLVAASLAARGGAPQDELEGHFDSMHRLIESWRAT